jgi:hypothetical protein
MASILALASRLVSYASIDLVFRLSSSTAMQVLLKIPSLINGRKCLSNFCGTNGICACIFIFVLVKWLCLNLSHRMKSQKYPWDESLARGALFGLLSRSLSPLALTSTEEGRVWPAALYFSVWFVIPELYVGLEHIKALWKYIHQ